MIHKYACTEPGCRAQLTWDDAKRTQHVVYPRGSGPLAPGYRPHDCPVRKGLVPPEIDAHPLAKKVA